MPDIRLTTQDGAALDASGGDLYFPYRGNWSSHLTLADTPDVPPSGRVTLDYHGLELHGYILRAGTSEGQTGVLVVGGAGGLWKVPDAKYYDHQIPVRLPLSEILDAAGESLSTNSSADILGATLPSWPRRQDEAGHLLDTLADAAGALWRMLPDGTVFFGRDAFAKSQALDTDWTLISTDPEWLIQEYAPLKNAELLPGVSFGELGKVGRVHYEDDGAIFIARIWFLDGDTVEDHVVAGLRAIMREEMRATAYHPTFGGQVVQQRTNGTLDVQLDDRRLPPLTSVPYLVPIPGSSLDVSPNARVQVMFAGGDPRRPMAMLYDSGDGNKKIGIDGDEVDVGTFTVTAVANGAITIAYKDPFSPAPINYTLGSPIPLKGKLKGGGKLKHP